jgi:hypothetical protein
MTTLVDPNEESRGQKVGSRIRLSGRVFAVEVDDTVKHFASLG